MFEQVIGQHDIQQRLMQLVSEERLPHALMLCGPQGCGKKALAKEIVKCKTDEQARQLGIEWTTAQCQELYDAGIHNIHFYTVSAVDSVAEIAKRLL